MSWVYLDKRLSPEEGRHWSGPSWQAHCSSFISFAMVKHPDQKSNLEEKKFIIAHNFRLQSIDVGKSGQELEAVVIAHP